MLFTRKLLTGAGTAALCLATPGLAQTAEPAPAGQADQAVNDIVVTAQFRAQRLQDTPIAITATTGAALEARSLTSVTDLTATAPNVNLSSASGLNGSAVNAYIRGIGQNDSSFALEPGVG